MKVNQKSQTDDAKHTTQFLFTSLNCHNVAELETNLLWDASRINVIFACSKDV